LNPTFVEAHNILAWILATHPDPNRAPAGGGDRARRNRLRPHVSPTPVLLNVLGAAYASAGRYADAGGHGGKSASDRRPLGRRAAGEND
jgi:hypothetical protein